MAASLTSQDIHSVANATDHFGENQGLLVCRPGRSFWKPYFTIPEGFYALVTSHGADINYTNGKAVWPSGFHWGAPWVKVSNLVTKQSVVFDTPVTACKTSDNVSVEIDIAIVFRIMGDESLGEDPDMVRKFVHEVGPRGLENQLRGAQEEAVRALARSMEHTQVYGLRTGGEKDAGALAAMVTEGASQLHTPLSGGHDENDAVASVAHSTKGNEICNAMRTRLNKQFVAQGVMVTAVIIQNVRLPENIVVQMTEKTMVISSNNEQKMNQLSDMQLVSYNEEIETVKQRLTEEREQEKQLGTQKANEVSIKLSTMKSMAQKSLKLIKEENDVTIQKINADGDLQVSRLVNSKDAYASAMRAKSEQEEAKTMAECDKYVEVKLAEAELAVARNEAAAAEVLAAAEGKMAKMVAAKKAYETQIKRLEVAEALAYNPNLIISGNDNPEFNTLMMCDAILSDVTPGQPISRSQVLAELGVVQKSAKVYLNAPTGLSG